MFGADSEVRKQELEKQLPELVQSEYFGRLAKSGLFPAEPRPEIGFIVESPLPSSKGSSEEPYGFFRDVSPRRGRAKNTPEIEVVMVPPEGRKNGRWRNFPVDSILVCGTSPLDEGEGKIPYLKEFYLQQLKGSNLGLWRGSYDDFEGTTSLGHDFPCRSLKISDYNRGGSGYWPSDFLLDSAKAVADVASFGRSLARVQEFGKIDLELLKFNDPLYLEVEAERDYHKGAIRGLLDRGHRAVDDAVSARITGGSNEALRALRNYRPVGLEEGVFADSAYHQEILKALEGQLKRLEQPLAFRAYENLFNHPVR
ncbi:MAG: hypothetical protein JW727_02205 [Candidatus Aenigmarchaeota archaeon]|nr:hypothetical protein [Candidatus Aenigmarchaeota archaeon]